MASWLFCFGADSDARLRSGGAPALLLSFALAAALPAYLLTNESFRLIDVTRPFRTRWCAPAAPVG